MEHNRTPEHKPSQPQLLLRSNSTRNDETSSRSNKSQRSPLHHSIATSNSNSNRSSQSAWALSPGRSLDPDHLNKNSRKTTTVVVTSKTKSGRGGVSGVLKYFKTKKPSPMTERQFHHFRMLHNRLVQWRFTNAKAEAATASVEVQAEDKLFTVWLQTLKMRNMIMEKRMWVQKHEQRTKLLDIVNPQICLLEEWMRIEKRNFEAVSRLTRKLSAISVQLPLVYGAEGDVGSVYDSMRRAMEVLEECIPRLVADEVEMTCSLLQQLSITAEQQRECLKELSYWIETVSSLEVAERSTKLWLIGRTTYPDPRS